MLDKERLSGVDVADELLADAPFLLADPHPSQTAVVLDDERAAFLTWWCADVLEYTRDLGNNNATDKLVGAWEGFQYALTLARAASPQPVEQTAERMLFFGLTALRVLLNLTSDSEQPRYVQQAARIIDANRTKGDNTMREDLEQLWTCL